MCHGQGDPIQGQSGLGAAVHLPGRDHREPALVSHSGREPEFAPRVHRRPPDPRWLRIPVRPDGSRPEPDACVAVVRRIQRIGEGFRVFLGEPVLLEEEGVSQGSKLRDGLCGRSGTEGRRRKGYPEEEPLGWQALEGDDRDGNPVDISAVVVWRVVETAEALLVVDDYEDYVAIQSESALRNLASRHPYDSKDDEISLRGNTQDISEQLRQDIQEHLERAGVEVIEARISHLAYSAEIAAAMLQRQQAQAVVAARTKIVEGAVGMVQMALEHLKKDNIVELDDERRAAMVSNLLVVLCSDRHTQPVVNTGSLYQ